MDATAPILVLDEPELDAATVGRVFDDIRAQLTRYESRSVVLDMGNVRFCDCSGLGALVRLRNELRVSDGTVRLKSLHPMVERSLRIGGLAGTMM